MGTSEQIGFGPRAFRKLQSCLVAAEAACSKGDFPVVTVEIALAAVVGLAAATETAVVPAELAAVVPALPKKARAAAQPLKLKQSATLARMMQGEKKKADQTKRFGLL
jgi:hypothetical protein